ncbi:N-alpha-acetyltransferase 16, NatA auxiliary subunit [Dionaea muscipula]
MGMLDAKPSDTPMFSGVKLVPEQGDPYKEPDQYRRLVGKLNYFSITRPNIAFSVSVVSQFIVDPRTPHWKAAVHILRYVMGHQSKGLFYRDHGYRRIEGFFDADWTRSPSDRRSTTGYCVFIGGNLVFWKSKKQSVVARSSAEFEYRALAHVTSDATYLRQLLDELKYLAPRPIQIWCDSQSAIHIASNLVFHERTKHIEVDCHFVREKLQDGDIVFNNVKTEDQLGDILTKPLIGIRVKFLCNKLGMINIYAPT